MGPSLSPSPLPFLFPSQGKARTGGGDALATMLHLSVVVMVAALQVEETAQHLPPGSQGPKL